MFDFIFYSKDIFSKKIITFYLQDIERFLILFPFSNYSKKLKRFRFEKKNVIYKYLFKYLNSIFSYDFSISLHYNETFWDLIHRF